nr:phage-related tail fiber protein [uncultured Mediterranean phage uvMED]BAR24956.1 phage-related tail fiber protein [uncultured Mediterranean phage uvMED]BAR39205.1 phage-related tail fiber protein [uncultured Mediterranean phage uvMED]BAR39259.1 phage-related tail fiber protein [uncultured Mediterranean phage uvMED]
MADQRITQLVELSKAGVAQNDVLAIADVSGSETKKVTAKNLVDAGLDLVDASSIDLGKLDQASTTKIGTAALADDGVTYAKIQNVTATDRLLGRSSANAGIIEEIVCTAAGRALLDDANAAAQRTTLGIDTNDAVTFGTVTANLSSTSATITGGTITGITDLTVADGGTGSSTAAGARVNLGVELGVDVQSFDAGLQSISSLTTAANQSIYLTGSDTYAAYSLTAAGRALLDDADAAAQRTTLGLGALATLSTVNASTITNGSVGTDELANSSVTIGKLSLVAQDLAGSLIANGGITATQLASDSVVTAKIINDAVTYAKIQDVTATDRLLGRSTAGAGVVEEIACTAAGRALIDDANAAAQRTTLGLGTLATQSGTFSGTHSGTSSGTNTGDQTITLTGAVTGTGTGSFATTLAAGIVGTSNIASDAVTYDKLQDTTTTDVILGRSTSGAGTIEQIACTSAGRALLDDANAAAQRTTLGLGDLAVATGTWTNGSSFAGTSSGTNTGDQTITLTGAVTGSGTGSFATTLASNIVGAANIQTNAVTTSKINESAIDEDKLGDQSTCIVSAATPSGTGAFTGQGWFNTATSIAYRWSGAAWTQVAGIQTVTVTESTPLSIVVNNPDAFTANITLTLETQVANSVFAGPASGSDAAPTFRTLVPADLPDATSSAKGIIQPGTGLVVASGTLNHSNSVTGATKSGITFDAQGHITAAVDLIASDIPVLDTAKITTGTFPTDRIGAGAITATKLANKSTASIGETLPVAAFTGQLHFNPLDKNFFLWDGNVWQSIGISAGAIILGGTYNATTNQIASVTNEGTAIGLAVGNALPSPSEDNANYYLVVSIGGTGTSPAPTVTLAPPDLLLSTGTSWLEIDVSSTYTAQTANNVAFAPAGEIGATNVQTALEEVSNESRNAENITSGVLDVDHGGTNIAAYTKGDLIAASGATTLDKLGVGTNGFILSANSSTTTGLEWITNQVGTVTSVSVTAPLGVTNGTTTPALTISTGTTSAVGVLQLTDGVASSSTTTAATPNGVKTAYDLAALAMPKAGGIFTGQVLVGNTGSLVFEGPTDDAFETTLAIADPTVDRTITLPNLTGTVALTSQLDDGSF